MARLLTLYEDGRKRENGGGGILRGGGPSPPKNSLRGVAGPNIESNLIFV